MSVWDAFRLYLIVCVAASALVFVWGIVRARRALRRERSERERAGRDGGEREGE